MVWNNKVIFRKVLLGPGIAFGIGIVRSRSPSPRVSTPAAPSSDGLQPNSFFSCLRIPEEITRRFLIQIKPRAIVDDHPLQFFFLKSVALWYSFDSNDFWQRDQLRDEEKTGSNRTKRKQKEINMNLENVQKNMCFCSHIYIYINSNP